MNPYTYFHALTEEEKQAFADRAKTRLDYLKAQVFHAQPIRFGTPRFMNRLADASQGGFTATELFEYQNTFVRLQMAEEQRERRILKRKKAAEEKAQNEAQSVAS